MYCSFRCKQVEEFNKQGKAGGTMLEMGRGGEALVETLQSHAVTESYAMGQL